MATWPSNWKQRAIVALGIDPTPKALNIISAWSRSTPLQPWTNNPLGMPALSGRTRAVPSTPYAMFGSMPEFYAALARFAATTPGKAVAMEMSSDAGYGPAWRAISSLGWPGGKTETDYPSAVLDLAEQSYRDSVNAVDASQRKTSGAPKAPPDTHAAIKQQAQSIVHAANAFNNAAAATRFLIRRHAKNGN